MPRPLRVLVVLAALVGLVVAVGGVLGVATVRRSFPQTSGKLDVPGLSGRVVVLRDRYGVPQLYAESAEDLFRAQGFVHAQDRFWEMDFRRHVTAGRLAELLGSDAVDTDKVVRTMGWRRVAEQELRLLSPETRRWLDAYAQGVNAWLAGRKGSELSLEYAVLGLRQRGYRPEPWTAADSVAWLKAMAWDLRSNVEEEIERTRLAVSMPPARVDELYPPYPFDRHRPVVTTGRVVAGRYDASPLPTAPAARRAVSDLLPVVRRVPQLLGSGGGVGSNAWAVAGSHTTTGKPLLANDPHLKPQMPSLWYQMGLHCTAVTAQCPFDVAGYTFSGTPGVIVGHNQRVAWGVTNLGADVADLVLERVDGDTYDYAGRRLPLATRAETIRVAGGDDVRITVRSTRHGPLLSDASSGYADVGRHAPVAGRDRPAYGVALRWTALTPGRTADAIFLFDRARSWPEFRRAAQRFEVPAQNLVYADVDGHIGYQAPGRIPVRSRGDGRWPVPGWTGRDEWTSYIPFDALPSVLDPREGYVVTANQAVVGPSYPYLLTKDWDYGYRSQRIVDVLDKAVSSGSGGKVDVAAMQRLQTDTWNANAATLLPYLLKVDVGADWYDDGQELLRGWDLRQPAGSAPAAYFNAVWRNLLARTFHDQLPEDAWPDGEARWFEVVRGLLRRPEDPWWDDTRTDGRRETRDEILRAALRDARAEMTRLQGKDPKRWRWGRVHSLEVRNQTFGKSGVGPVEWLFNRGPLDVGGGNGVVDATGWDAATGYHTNWAPSMRMVIDLGDLDRSRWVNLTGASGHAFNAHYFDQADLWRRGATTAWPFRRRAVVAAAEDRLVLRPPAV